MNLPKRLEIVIDAVAPVNGLLEGNIDNWPANIQDELYKRLEARGQELGMMFIVVESYGGFDLDAGYFVRVIAKATTRLH